MIKVAAFDIGGTLMEYKGMPGVWIDYYENGLRAIRDKMLPELTDSDIKAAVTILRGYNPTVKYREADYGYERIFSEILQEWKISGVDIRQLAFCFFESFDL